MAETSTQITSKAPSEPVLARAISGTSSGPAATRHRPGILSQALKAAASLRVTVVLFALSIFLIFSGTLAQLDLGIWTVVAKYFRSFYVWIPLQIYFSRDYKIGGGIPYPGGWLLGTLLLANLLAAHATRFRVTAKRSGILLLHAGLILLMVSELVTGAFATEGSMTIVKDGKSNYVMSPHEPELAILSTDGSDKADVVVVPLAHLRHSGSISNELLPFDLEVLEYMPNSNLFRLGVPEELLPAEFARLRSAPAETANRGTAGPAAKALLATPAREVGGVEQNKEDHPALYLRLKEKGTGRDLGTYLLLIVLQDEPQYISVGGKRYDLRLRFKRTYKPYTVKLIEFRHDVYVGTNTPKNFSSKIKMVDPERGVEQEVLISMNNPFRYGGETFYQQSFLPDDSGTILQVVRNPGWLMPYVSCTMVGLGLVIHFGIVLVGFLGRRGIAPGKSAIDLPKGAIDVRKKGALQYIPGGATLAVALVYVLAVAMPSSGRSAGGLDLAAAAQLPVVAGGRVQPLDTVARNSLKVINGARQDYVDLEGETQPAIRWILEVMTAGDKGLAHKLRVFRIESDQVVGFLQLRPHPTFRYSYEEIKPRLDALLMEAKRPEASLGQEFQAKAKELIGHLGIYYSLYTLAEPLVVPPGQDSAEWQSLVEAMKTPAQVAMAKAFLEVLIDYSEGKADEFNPAIKHYRQAVEAKLATDSGRARFEVFFNHFAPFLHCTVLYVLVAILACGTWVAFPRQLGQAALALACVTLVVHTFALVGRMYIMDRWGVFVTNLYSSAVFIGWMCCITGLALERIYRNGLGTFVAGVLGALTLYIGHLLSTTGDRGDTLEMMQAVLDTNFWLATHVTTVAIGYSATFFAGFLAIALIVLRSFAPSLYSQHGKELGRMVYGILCFALIFSFVGTVLGGIWADQSWGRFWGWDPKENGALLIVIWNALILHARWGGMIQQRGIAVLAVGGNIVTAWSYFGVNLLGIGLHSYGFKSGTLYWLLTFVGAQMAVIAVGLVPNHWLQALHGIAQEHKGTAP
jgi:ABC-type transport system involved in cytochrome c biogenesis permease subunit